MLSLPSANLDVGDRHGGDIAYRRAPEGGAAGGCGQ